MARLPGSQADDQQLQVADGSRNIKNLSNISLSFIDKQGVP
jgi:hypothetical protein